MKIEPKNNCPLNNFEPCKELECAWFMHLRGNNPNTGEEQDEWGCSVAWLPIILMENSQIQSHTGSAIESFRNEMVRGNQETVELLVQNSKLVK